MAVVYSLNLPKFPRQYDITFKYFCFHKENELSISKYVKVVGILKNLFQISDVKSSYKKASPAVSWKLNVLWYLPYYKLLFANFLWSEFQCVYFLSKAFSVNRNYSHISEILVKCIKANNFIIYFSERKLKMELYSNRRKQENQITYMWKKLNKKHPMVKPEMNESVANLYKRSSQIYWRESEE